MDNVITALTSNGMIAPSYWIDPKTGNNYMLTVQYFDKQIQNMTMEDFKQIPLRGDNVQSYTPSAIGGRYQARSIRRLKSITTSFAASSTSM